MNKLPWKPLFEQIFVDFPELVQSNHEDHVNWARYIYYVERKKSLFPRRIRRKFAKHLGAMKPISDRLLTVIVYIAVWGDGTPISGNQYYHDTIGFVFDELVFSTDISLRPEIRRRQTRKLVFL